MTELLCIALGVLLTVAVYGYRLRAYVLVPRPEYQWVVKHAAKSPDLPPITALEVQNAIKAAQTISDHLTTAKALNMDTMLMRMGAEGFDGRERRLACETQPVTTEKVPV
jgi:hypothetical protein